MAKTEIRLPFGRLVSTTESDPPAVRRSLVVEDLVIDVDAVDAAPLAVRRIDGDGGGAEYFFIHDGCAIQGVPGTWKGATPDVAVRMLRADIERGGLPVPAERLKGKPVVDSGRTEQDLLRHEFEDRTVMIGGALYWRSPVPRIGLHITETGQVALRTSDGDGVAPWMAFPLTQREQAVRMAEAIADSLFKVSPFRDWRKSSPRGVSLGYDRWVVEDDSAFETLKPGFGGVVPDVEADRSYAAALIELLAPVLGHFPDEVVLSFVFVRKALGTDDRRLRSKLENLVEEIAETELPHRIDPEGRAAIAQAIFCLGLRLRTPRTSAAAGGGRVGRPCSEPLVRRKSSTIAEGSACAPLREPD